MKKATKEQCERLHRIAAETEEKFKMHTPDQEIDLDEVHHNERKKRRD